MSPEEKREKYRISGFATRVMASSRLNFADLSLGVIDEQIQNLNVSRKAAQSHISKCTGLCIIGG